jgi:hypothetical protein
MGMNNGENLIEQVISDFFARLEANPAVPQDTIKALKSLAAAGKLNDWAAVQAALQKSLGEEYATS